MFVQKLQVCDSMFSNCQMEHTSAVTSRPESRFMSRRMVNLCRVKHRASWLWPPTARDCRMEVQVAVHAARRNGQTPRSLTPLMFWHSPVRLWHVRADLYRLA